MQTNEMNIQPSETNTPIELKNQSVEERYYTFTAEELEELFKIPGEKTVKLTPTEWNYFVEKLKEEPPIDAFFDARYLAKITDPPRKFDTPQYPYIPCGDKSPGIDTVDLTPEEWKYFVEELKTKTPFAAFNNAKFIFKLDRSLAEIRAGKFVAINDAELEAFVNG